MRFEEACKRSESVFVNVQVSCSYIVHVKWCVCEFWKDSCICCGIVERYSGWG